MAQEVTATGREQRRDWRYACNGSVSLYDLITQRWLAGTLLDLSISGCLIRPDDPGALRAGDVIEVGFSLFGHSVRVTGLVRHVRADQSMGIEFRIRNEHAHHQMVRLMQRLADEWMRSQNSESQG
jgi:hypothetical protein